MKFRYKKIKREHSIIDGALSWLEDLSKNREVTDIIPGVIDVTHSRERGVYFQYETSSGCKLLVKNGGSIQEVFVVTSNPRIVQSWVAEIMEELDLMRVALDQEVPLESESPNLVKGKKNQSYKPSKKHNANNHGQSNSQLFKRDGLLVGTQEEYQLVELNKGLRDSLVDSLASMADMDDPKLEDVLDAKTREKLKKYSGMKNKKSCT